MNVSRRFYLNGILQKVIEDYNKKIKNLIIEEEYPSECEIIHNRFKTKLKSILNRSKYEELKLKIKEYEELKKLL